MKSGRNISEDEVFESGHLPKVPDISIAGSSHGHGVTFRSLVIRPRSVSSTPHSVPEQVSLNLSGIPNTRTSGEDTNRKAEGMPNVGPTPCHQKLEEPDRIYPLQCTACSLWLKNLERYVN